MIEQIAKVVHYSYELDGQSEQTAEVRFFTYDHHGRWISEVAADWASAGSFPTGRAGEDLPLHVEGFGVDLQSDLQRALVNNRARAYDDSLGRWASQVPLAFEAGDANLYRYPKQGPAPKAGEPPPGQ